MYGHNNINDDDGDAHFISIFLMVMIIIITSSIYVDYVNDHDYITVDSDNAYNHDYIHGDECDNYV